MKYTKEVLGPIVNRSKTITEVLKNLGVNKGSFKHIKRLIQRFDISTSHFEVEKIRLRNSSQTRFTQRVPLSDILVINSTYNRTHLKNRLYEANLKQRKCEMCGQGENWKGKKIALILDHINGISDDNRIENLRIVCPNCNATLDTHCGKNMKRKKPNVIKSGNQVRLKRRKVNRPNIDVILKDIRELGYVGTGRKYGVSDNAIRKWIK